MQPEMFAKISVSPSLKWLAVAIAFHIVNVFLGAFMGFRKKTDQLVTIHRLLYFAVLACLAIYLVMNQIHGENSIWEYLVTAYFITIVPVSKRWDVMVHALVTVVGLTLLPLLILLQLF